MKPLSKEGQQLRWQTEDQCTLFQLPNQSFLPCSPPPRLTSLMSILFTCLPPLTSTLLKLRYFPFCQAYPSMIPIQWVHHVTFFLGVAFGVPRMT